jgi:hypothetical protein
VCSLTLSGSSAGCGRSGKMAPGDEHVGELTFISDPLTTQYIMFILLFFCNTIIL